VGLNPQDPHLLALYGDDVAPSSHDVLALEYLSSGVPPWRGVLGAYVPSFCYFWSFCSLCGKKNKLFC
jgi:hypothetical protein